MPPNVNHLLIFDSVARAGSVTRGAEALMISQPAVSKQLKLLERSLGVRLFDRNHRGIRLTPAGEAVASHARRIAVLLEEVPRLVDDLSSLRCGRLRIGASPTITTYLLPDLLVQFRRKFPGVELRVETENSPLLSRRLLEDEIDIGLSESRLTSPDIESHVFAEDDFVPVAPPDHPVAKLRRVSRKGFLAQPLIAHDPIDGRISQVEQLLIAAGLDPHPILSLGTTEAMKRAVIAGLGVAFLPRLAITADLRDRRLVHVKLKGRPLRRSLYRCTVRSTGPTKPLIAFDCLLKHAVRGTLPPVGVRRA